MKKKCRFMAGAGMALVMVLLYVIPVQAGGRAALSEVEMCELTERIGTEYNICPELLQVIAWKESCFDPQVANGDCIGLMQVDRHWHGDRMEKLGVTDLHDPEGNMLVATDYLAELFSEYGEADVVLMFYSGNSRAVEYSSGVGEMSDYVWEVLEESMALEREHGK